MTRAESPSPADTSPSRPIDGALAWIVAAIAAVWILAATMPPRSYGDTLFSRLATVYALVHNGTFAIAVPGEHSSNPFDERTVDKVEVRGQTLSSKPPVLPLLMAAEYVVLRAIAGWSLEEPDDLSRITRAMTLSFVGFPFVVLVWALTRSVQWLGVGTGAVAFLAMASIFCTQAGAYATTFNNHVPAAAAVTLSFYFALRLARDPGAARPSTFLGFGAAAGVAATVDVPVVIFPVLLGFALTPRYLKPLLVWALPAAGIFVLVQTVALFVSTGSPWPVQLHPDVYLFENSHWRNPLGVDALNDPRAVYLFHMTLGRVGIFSLFPITLLAIPGVVVWMKRRPASAAIALCAVVGAVILVTYYALTTNNYGGSAFGFRWLIVLGPVFLLLAAPAFQDFKRGWRWAIPVVFFGVSCVSMTQCYLRPWDSNREWTTCVFGPSI